MKDVVIVFALLIAVIIILPIFGASFLVGNLSDQKSLMNMGDSGVTLLDRNGTPYYTLYQVRNKKFIPLTEIPDYMEKAVIAAEDNEFYRHSGFSIKGILRSVYVNFTSKELQSGGSTITQQLVKNAFLSSERSFIRKYQELILSYQVEKKYTKDDILEMYLNSIYFGENAFGIENAAMAYFGKHAQDITLAEATMLAGILPAPSVYSPISGDEEKAKTRQKFVLKRMLEDGYITQDDADSVFATSLDYNPVKEVIDFKAHHFANLVQKVLNKRYGEQNVARSGFKVKTTLNLDYQDYAETVVGNQVNNLRANRVTNGAAVVMDPKSGEVLALVGSYDWNDPDFGEINMADEPRQPGSSFKPIVYAAAFEQQIITPASVLKDEPTTFEGNYSPKNYDDKFRGDVLVRRALANSLNIPAVEVMSKVGLNNAMSMARKLGINNLVDASNYGLSLVLGAGEVTLLELTNAYATFANNGVRNDVAFILEIEDRNNKNIFTHRQNTTNVLRPEIAFLISSILSDNESRKETFGGILNLSRPAAVKTGTTENYRDALTLGYTPDLVVGAWVGNSDGSHMDKVAGSLGAAPIWRALMEKFSYGIPVNDFTPPLGVVNAYVCKSNGLILDNPNDSGYKEYFLSGTLPREKCTSDITVEDEKKNDENGRDEILENINDTIRIIEEDKQKSIHGVTDTNTSSIGDIQITP